MGITLLKEYQLGDMLAQYLIDEQSQNVELHLLPQGISGLQVYEKKHAIDGLVQLKLTGDIYPGGYAGGNTMRQGESVSCLQYEAQEYCTGNDSGDYEEIQTRLADKRGYLVTHYLRWYRGEKALKVYVTFENRSHNMVQLELLSSFSLSGITPFVQEDAYDTLRVHRIRSVWSMEGRLESRSMEELQLEPSWGGHAIRSERFGQVGSMPVNHWFPFLAIEDMEHQIFWGVQLAHNASWQMEIYRKDEGVSISGGLADREFGHWMKEIEPDEKFTTPAAILSVCSGGGIDHISQRLTSLEQRAAEAGPQTEQELPIIFNEYCTTWGNPSHANIADIIAAIKDKGFRYFVIDCGWYKEQGVPWDIAMGDYNVSKELFPDGLEQTVQMIRDAKMEPGIWFEIENVGSAARAYQETEHLLKRDGTLLTTSMRRFWDMRDSWTENYLTEKVIGTLLKYGFSYMKIDDNDTIGLGCDGAESLGEGLRQNMEASLRFIQKIKREVPGIILENCASGGHRLEPLMMQTCSMASFSDAHECEEIPIIAANLHRVILPRQSQIWAVIRKEDSLKRIAYSVANTFLGRMCLSGDVCELNTEQWAVIDRGIAFYRLIAPIIKHGYTYRYGTEIKSYRHPKGWQGILRVGEGGDVYALFHIFNEPEEQKFLIPLPEGADYTIEAYYSDQERNVVRTDAGLVLSCTDVMCAVAVRLRH